MSYRDPQEALVNGALPRARADGGAQYRSQNRPRPTRVPFETIQKLQEALQG